METGPEKGGAPAGSSAQQKGPEPQTNRDSGRMRYSIMDILMLMALVALVAATAGPRFSQAASENRLSDMVESLHRLRSRIELYRMQNDGLLPGQDAHGADVSADEFMKSMTGRGAGWRCMQIRALPANPFISGDAARSVTCVNAIDALPTGEEGTGWWFNAATGQFRACNSRFHSVY